VYDRGGITSVADRGAYAAAHVALPGADAALLIAAISRRERADAPAPPPPVPGEEGVPLGPSSPFDPSVVVEVPGK
jgi:hypothetical protein